MLVLSLGYAMPGRHMALAGRSVLLIAYKLAQHHCFMQGCYVNLTLICLKSAAALAWAGKSHEALHIHPRHLGQALDDFSQDGNICSCSVSNCRWRQFKERPQLCLRMPAETPKHPVLPNLHSTFETLKPNLFSRS